MFHYWLELILWSLLAYLLGCLVGCFLKKVFGTAPQIAGLGAAGAVAAGMAMPKVATPAAPSIPKAAIPAAPAMPAAPKVVAPAMPAAPTVVAPAAKVVAPTSTVVAPASTVVAPAGKMERPKGLSGARGGKHDNLQRISGIGPQNEKILHGLGIYHFDQIANWSPSEIAWVEDHLRFGGRIERENWKRQARLLADGKEDEFMREYGTGGLKGADGETHSGTETRRGHASEAASGSSRGSSSQSSTTSSGGSMRMERPKGLSSARGGKADNLQRISGIGPKNEGILHNLGFYHFDQIAEWTASEVAWVEDHLRFGGRIERENWKRQARLLADGKEEEFMREYGTGGMKGSDGQRRSGSTSRRLARRGRTRR